MSEEEKEQPIIIKKINKGGGHHGGAWKVAYADFVTAMMAFFLLLWLLNVTTEEEKTAIANYFDPTHPKVSDSSSGAGGVMGGLSMSPQGAMATNVQNMAMPQPAPPSGSQGAKTAKEKAIEKAKKELKQAEERKFKQAERRLKQVIQDDPDLAALADNLIIDMTPEGLRIQIVDKDGAPMFPSGSARMFEKTKTLMTKVAQAVSDMPNEISIRGHTDSIAYGAAADYTNWELSSDRANASRRVMLEAGIPKSRVNNVVGKADTEPLLKDDPTNARNRRISIVLLREELTNPDYQKNVEEAAQNYEGEFEDDGQGGASAPAQVPVGTFRKSPGQIEFP